MVVSYIPYNGIEQTFGFTSFPGSIAKYGVASAFNYKKYSYYVHVVAIARFT